MQKFTILVAGEAQTTETLYNVMATTKEDAFQMALLLDGGWARQEDSADIHDATGLLELAKMYCEDVTNWPVKRTAVPTQKHKDNDADGVDRRLQHRGLKSSPSLAIVPPWRQGSLPNDVGQESPQSPGLGITLPIPSANRRQVSNDRKSSTSKTPNAAPN